MLINKKATKEYILEYCKQNRSKFTRVSGHFFSYIEERLKKDIREYLHTLPSIGKTVKVLVFSVFISTSAYADTASWYSFDSCRKEGTNGYFTASGERFNEKDLTAASWQYPFQSKVKVTNLNNGKSIIVTINDRGPSKRLIKKGRVIDLSRGSFSRIANLSDGVISVKVEIFEP
jgi:rare lipoprotein A